MPTIQLTDIVARTAKPAAGKQITYWDQSVPNFGLRVGERSKTWVVMLGADVRRRLSIGRYPAMSVQDARLEARRLLLTAVAARRDHDIAVVPFSDALEKFIEVHLAEKKASTAGDWERMLRKHFEPIWKKRLMPEITRADVAGVINRLLKEGGEANNAFAVARVFFRWCVRRGYLMQSPMQSLTLPVRHEPRDRVLSRSELKAVLGAADTRTSFGIIVFALLLSVQRRGEIGGLHSSWIDRENALLTLPKEMTKNGLEHAVPLSPTALSLLPTREGLLFPARGKPDRSFAGWSKSMAALRRACGVDFRLHDLRRTGATMMASLGVPPYVIERILNHITASTSESITPLARIYNRHRYLGEMRSALLLLEREVLGLLRECSVVPFVDTGFQPSLDFGFDPADAARPELDSLRKAPGLFEPIDVRRRVENESP